ncbi:hypothetical protein V6N11_065795 [Hibiscus sabdariffa]|uniref:Uncharacterized protein n=1 Tax=Hibiscus sabdariffa TaxID=183260 RepID=A0ABR2PID2_9ROSI
MAMGKGNWSSVSLSRDRDRILLSWSPQPNPIYVEAILISSASYIVIETDVAFSHSISRKYKNRNPVHSCNSVEFYSKPRFLILRSSKFRSVCEIIGQI